MKRMILPLSLLMAMALYLTAHDDGQERGLRADNSRWMGNEPRYHVTSSHGATSEPLPVVGRELE